MVTGFQPPPSKIKLTLCPAAILSHVYVSFSQADRGKNLNQIALGDKPKIISSPSLVLVPSINEALTFSSLNRFLDSIIPTSPNGGGSCHLIPTWLYQKLYPDFCSIDIWPYVTTLEDMIIMLKVAAFLPWQANVDKVTLLILRGFFSLKIALMDFILYFCQSVLLKSDSLGKVNFSSFLSAFVSESFLKSYTGC